MLYSRFLKRKDTTLTDITREISNYDFGTSVVNLEKDTDYLYIGQILPFNHLYFKVSTVNDVAADLSIDYWDGTSWRAMVDVIDETSESGVPFAKSGYITWVPNKQYIWYYDDTVINVGTEKITGLGDSVIYDMFWIRIKASVNLKSTTALSWAGNLFSDDTNLYAEYPLFNSSSYKTSVETGKTDWEKQHVIAAKLIANDLKRNSKVITCGQILDRNDMQMASVSRTAAVIYNLLGRDWDEEYNKAKKEAAERMNFSFQKIDRGSWGRLQSNSQVRPGMIMRI